jgi:hypothetical protein
MLAKGTGATGNAIAAGSRHIVLASGKSLVVLDRESSRKDKVAILPSLEPRGTITGLAFDGSSRLWIAEQSGMIRGPLDLPDRH